MKAMMRAIALLVVLPVWTSGSIHAETGGTPHDAKLPNILVCIADDMSWAHMGAAGDPAVQTPNIDRLASAGVVFEHAFCSSPSCAPSRAALLTGQVFCRLKEGANLLGALPSEYTVYPDLLEESGYHVGFSGKGWGPGDWRAGGRTRNPAGPKFRSFNQFLNSLPAGKPFCFWLGSFDPHRPYDQGSGTKAGIDPAKIVVPSAVPDTPQLRSDLADYLFEVQRFDQMVGRALRQLEERKLNDNTIVVVTSDNGMPYPRAKCNLYDWGVRIPLVISWPELIPQNRKVTDFVSHVDLAPTFLELAGLPVPETMTGRSLLPLLSSSESGRIDDQRDRVFLGRERHDVFRKHEGRPVGYPMRALRTDAFLYIRNFRPERVPSGDSPDAHQDNDRGPAKRFVVTRRQDESIRPFYARAYAKRPAEEFYDLSKDPGQINNVAEQAAYAEVLAHIRGELESWMTSVNDPRRPGGDNPDIFDTYPAYPPRRRN